MDDTVKNIKQLKIKGEVHAKYTIDKGIIYIKCIRDDYSEDRYVEFISKREPEKIHGVAYLNI